MRNLFRAEVPEETIRNLMLCVGWKTYNDPQRAVLCSEKVDEAFTEIWPYYWPVWAEQFLKVNPSLKEVMTVIRQVLRQKRIKIVPVERNNCGVRKTFYYLHRPRGYVDYQPSLVRTTATFSVDFN